MTMPISPNPTWEIIDSSKMQQFMSCRRAFFYRYILGWTSEFPSIHLSFGGAWHIAMEHLLLNGYGQESIRDAYEGFLSYLQSHSQPELYTDKKNPSNALEALITYANTYANDDFEVLETEIAGTVPINSKGDKMHFRLDGIIKDKAGNLLLMEHKTGSQFSAAWERQWILSIQVATYIHAMYCYYGKKDVWGAIVNGTFFLKTKTNFYRAKIRKTPDQMRNWMVTANFWHSEIKRELEILMTQDSVENPIMKSFPMSPTACSNYSGCPYHDLCSTFDNPLRWCSEPPSGMKTEWWNPEEAERPAKKVVELEA